MAHVRRFILDDERDLGGFIHHEAKEGALPSFVHSGDPSFCWRQTVEYSSRRLSDGFYCRVIVGLSIMSSLSRTRSLDISLEKWFDGKYSCASDSFSVLRDNHLSNLINCTTWNISRRLKNPVQVHWGEGDEKIHRFYTFGALLGDGGHSSINIILELSEDFFVRSLNWFNHD